VASAHHSGKVKMTKWAMRILGLLNVLFGIAGIWYYIADLTWHLQKWEAAYSVRDWFVFSALSLYILSLVCFLAYFGIRLILGNRSALRFTIIVFALETLYFFADVGIFWLILPASVAHAAIGFWERAWDLIAPQIITAYPVFGIIACSVLLRWGKYLTDSVPAKAQFEHGESGS
jgi:succinate dehydrogenase hydrophobic anchor subunit